jgi:hypothetical protein
MGVPINDSFQDIASLNEGTAYTRQHVCKGVPIVRTNWKLIQNPTPWESAAREQSAVLEDCFITIAAVIQ